MYLQPKKIDRTSVKLMSHLRKMTKLTKWKSDKINCRIKFKPHAHLQTMEKKMCKVA